MYDKPYVKFDDFGLAQVCCMGCGCPIIVRSYIEMTSMKDPTKKEKVMTLKRLSSHTEVQVKLSDGSVTGLPHCKRCATGDLNKEAANHQRINAMRLEMEFAGKSKDHIAAVMERHESVQIEEKENFNAR